MGYEIPVEFRPHAAPILASETDLALEWCGTAGFRLTFRNTILLVDPFVTRPSPAHTRLAVNAALGEKCFPRADHILIGHSHYDHLMDAPLIALRTGATVHGSSSTVAVCRGAKIPEEKIHVVEPHQPFACGDFQATFIPSLHGKALMGRVPCPGEITGAPPQPMPMSAYRHGGAFGLLIEAAGFRMYHLGSADLIEEELDRVGPVDALLLGIAGRGGTPDYVKRVADRTRPGYLIPHHYDNFFRPLSHGLHLLHGVRMEDFLEEARNVCGYARILMPGWFEKVAFDTATKSLL